jgi:hypothetical protein
MSTPAKQTNISERTLRSAAEKVLIRGCFLRQFMGDVYGAIAAELGVESAAISGDADARALLSAFSDYGSCGPCGGVDTARQRQLRWQLSGISPGQLPPRAPRRSLSTRASYSRRRARELELSDPPAQPPRNHALTVALCCSYRSLDGCLIRYQRPRLDGPRPRARCNGLCRRYQRLRRPRRRLE